MRSKAPKNNDDSISLNKFISDTGFCSRREADNLIVQGRVTINDVPAITGNRVGGGDVVEIDGEPLGKKVKTIYIAFNKPEGVTSTTDTKDKNNIVDYLNHKERIFPIGRLDKESEGLIFLTNDGNIVNKILRAGNAHEKEYVVTVDKPITKEFIAQMSDGVVIMGTKTQRCKVTMEAKSVFRIVLTQGLNRQIRRMCFALDYKVTKLKRVRIMNVHLGTLPEAHWRYLTDEEVASINKLVAGSSKTEEASPRRKRAERVKPAAEIPQKKKKDGAFIIGAPYKPVEKKDTKEAVKKPVSNKELKRKTFKDFRNGGKK